MASDIPQETDSSVAPDARLLLLAASRHDLKSLQELLHTVPASVQDPETGFTPLHAAIAGADPSKKPSLVDEVPNGGHLNGDDTEEKEASGDEAAIETVKLLLLNGAIWNDLNKDDETPGCLALRLGLKDLYNIMVDAGVRAEVLLNRLDEYEQLNDQESDEDPDEDIPDTTHRVEDDNESLNNQPPSSQDPLPNQPTYLSSTLSFQPNRILDSSTNSVMMSWETNLMSRTASLLAPCPGLRILNIGHGMGIIDTHFQSTTPSTHHIIEAHPSVLAQMREKGWYEKPNVVIHAGRWQDVLPTLIENEEDGTMLFDVIYFDTFAEPYSALRKFFEDFVIVLLDDGGTWGYFNGLGADRQVCYDVYGKVVELDLFEAGFEVEWMGVEVPDLEERGEWDGVKRPYWRLKEYRLPVCRFIG
ncbi:MAG: hypothetical protein L6R38_004576 [Xanthoria sp. 2 TBL-2021]|nr:MAG: hypothetical protein L6R38_004576 [Xanthoria sp. 2 TBL-2021]